MKDIGGEIVPMMRGSSETLKCSIKKPVITIKDNRVTGRRFYYALWQDTFFTNSSICKESEGDVV